MPFDGERGGGICLDEESQFHEAEPGLLFDLILIVIKHNVRREKEFLPARRKITAGGSDHGVDVAVTFEKGFGFLPKRLLCQRTEKFL